MRYLLLLLVLTACGEDIQVIQGPKGDSGAQGLAGKDGLNGIDGLDGTDGADGIDGVDGEDGLDGTNGTDAVWKMGTVGNMVPSKQYSSCHHDYLYVSNSVDPNKGWLLFRHQKNGSSDQGIGSTGFQVWNVDITSFSLASEVGNVTYCNLTWNPNTRLLTYTVVDSSDGLNGTSGSINLN
jgi:hypothetical protein